MIEMKLHDGSMVGSGYDMYIYIIIYITALRISRNHYRTNVAMNAVQPQLELWNPEVLTSSEVAVDTDYYW